LRCKARPQDIVSINNGLERAFERSDIEWAREPNRQGDVVHRRAGTHLVEEPEALLGK
jgi:hypothetical protein